ncbi:prepilin-type N-terminal cleavage/methylation domain-containing protein [Candidatus Woesebacteria bacterium]|nr:prepilin-type N-terminal cleavage/methylation domain-containing protein [Candidatus Woesebacteria bacterium]
MNKRINNEKGYTLVEILVVVMVFSILGLVVTGVVTTTLRSSGKSENSVVVRENVNYAMGVMERQIRNAEEVTCDSDILLTYTNSDGSSGETFECVVDGNGIGQIQSSNPNGFLTNDSVDIECSGIFDCSTAPDVVDVLITATDAQSAAGENALTTDYSESIRIKLRNY